MSRSKGMNADNLNLYHLTDWLIKPCTNRRDCSFVELLTATRQVPAWFCNHWRGESVKDFIQCVTRH